MKKKGIAITGLMAILLQGCLPRETPVPVHEAGDVLTASVNMEHDYKWQIYYDLNSNTQVGKNNKAAWDLGFESGTEGYRIILNNAKLMAAYQTDKTDFAAVQHSDTTGKLRRDSPTGSLDSTAIGDWRNGNPIYIIDRARDGNTFLGLKTVQILSVDDQKYQIRIADIDGSNDQTISIPKEEQYNFTFISLADGEQISVEPPKETWDIVFTQYTHIYHHLGNTPYTVTGCLLNRYNTSVAIDTVRNFADITYENIPSYTFSTHINAIGFDWKVFSLDDESYQVSTHKNYIIRTAAGTYFKLHFVDFISPTGEKGSPRWEFQEL